MTRPMKDSGVEWIGKIPKEWKIIKGRYCFDVQSGFPFESDKFSVTKGFPLIRIRDITSGMIETFYDGDYSDEFIVKQGDFLIGMDGDFNERIWENQPALLNQRCCRILEKQKYERKFLFYTLPFYLNLVNQLTYSTTVKHLSFPDLREADIPSPSLSEQRHIVNFLDDKCSAIDNVIIKTQESIEEYKKLKQAMITEAVTKGVRGKRPMKDSSIDWIGQIPQEWSLLKLKYITRISRGLFNHRPRNDIRFYNGKYPFIQTGDVAGANKYITTYSQTLNELGKDVSKEFPAGTLTMTIAANVGDVAILEFDAYFPDSVVGFIPKTGFDTMYMYYVFRGMKDVFVRTAIKNTQLNLNIDRMKEMQVSVTPDKSEQKEIADYLDKKCAAIDTLIEKKQQFIEELTAYKKSLIYEYVTGKKEVPA